MIGSFSDPDPVGSGSFIMKIKGINFFYAATPSPPPINLIIRAIFLFFPLESWMADTWTGTPEATGESSLASRRMLSLLKVEKTRSTLSNHSV